MLKTIEQNQGTRRPNVQGVDPEAHNALYSMDQPEFSTMLLKMTGESLAAEAARPNNDSSQAMQASYDLGIMPELAFDFSLPFDDDGISFGPPLPELDSRAWTDSIQPQDTLLGTVRT